MDLNDEWIENCTTSAHLRDFKVSLRKKYLSQLARLQERLSLLVDKDYETSRTASEIQVLEGRLARLRDDPPSLPELQEFIGRQKRQAAECKTLFEQVQSFGTGLIRQHTRIRDMEDSLAAVREELHERRAVPPPYLRKVEVRRGRTEVYRAEWLAGTIGIQERIDLLRAAIKLQQEVVRLNRREWEQARTSMLVASEENLAALEDYERWAGGYFAQGVLLNVAAEAVAIGASIYANTESLGSWHAAALFEVVWQSGRLLTDYPDLTFDPFTRDPSSQFRQFVLPESAPGEAAFKEAVKAAIAEGLGFALKDTGLGLRLGGRPVREPSQLLNLGSIQVRAASLGGRHTVPTAMAQFRSKLRKIGLRSLIQSSARLGFGTGVGIAAEEARVAVERLTTHEAVERFQRFLETDFRARSSLHEFLSSGERHRAAESKLEAMRALVPELREWYRKPGLPPPYLRVQRKPFEVPGRLRVRLWFDNREPSIFEDAGEALESDVQMASVSVRLLPAGDAVSARESGAGYWQADVETQDTTAEMVLEVAAADQIFSRELDSNPGTRVVHSMQSISYYEPGPDRMHRLLTMRSTENDQSPRASVVFLLDVSYSMDDTTAISSARPVTRLEAAVAGIRSYLEQSGPQHVEFALVTFCGESEVEQSFTEDASEIEATLDGLSTCSATALAEAILRAGSLLITEGSSDLRNLVILSDGQETEGGDHVSALQRVHAAGIEYEFEPIR